MYTYFASQNDSLICQLLLFLLDMTISPSEQPAGMIDLKLVKDITPYDKAGKEDFTRFNVDLEDKMYKFKVNSQAEGRKWVEGLNEWRDHFLMNMT